MPRHRRNRVAEHLAVVVAYVAGGAAAFAPPAPTGRPLVDATLLGIAVAGVVYAAASAPWWLLVIAAGAALTVAINPVAMVVAALALGLALYIGVRRRNLPELRAVSAGLTFNALAWAELEGFFFGLTAIIGCVAALAVFIVGIRRRPRTIRRRAWTIVGLTGAVAVVAGVGLGIAGASARSSLARGQQLAEQGISALNEGDFALAAERLEQSAASLQRADNQLSRPWALPAALVPVVSQHRSAALDLTGVGATAIAEVGAALRQIDPDRLRVTAGQIDLQSVRALAEPFQRVDAALDEVGRALLRADSPWLVPPVGDALASVSDEVAENAPRVDNAVTAAELAPQLLGGDGPRRYLALFTTPAEARGLGGFPGNYAELTFDDGRIAMTEFGRVADLERIDQEIGTSLSEPTQFLELYGGFGFDNGQGKVGTAAWRNLTMTPHFPWVAQVAVDLYGQETGVELDGVLVLDVFVIEALLQYTGPIDLPSVGQQLNADNAAEFLLSGQYEFTGEDNPDRIDALEEAARATIDQLLAGSLPEPTTLARDLGPLAAERRLLVWTDDEAEQSLLRRVGLLGEIPPHAGRDGWSFAVNNAGGSKIDTYLRRRATYTSMIDAETGDTIATLRIELRNTAPAAGPPNYVIGNSFGFPPGTSRLYATFYSPLHVTAASINGETWGLRPAVEAGWRTYSNFLTIGPGDTVVIELQLRGHLERPDEMEVWEQPLSTPLEIVDDPADEGEG